MKLVERLAREMPEWPDKCHAIHQDDKGLLHQYVEYCKDGGDWFQLKTLNEIASDWAVAEVNRHQWKAERERITEEARKALVDEGIEALAARANMALRHRDRRVARRVPEAVRPRAMG